MPHPSLHPAVLEDDALLAECRIGFTRRSGPGGQHRNKVETAVVLKHLPTGLSAEASERRSQAENRTMAVFRLRLRLAMHIRQPIELPYAASPLWQSRIAAGRIQVSATHRDFPTLLAEALDVLVAHAMDPRPAAGELGVSPTQLIRLLGREPAALQQVNEERRRAGRHPLT